MALDRVVLDDLEWKGMVDAIRRRIPAASDGQWTLHAPVDPGVTLLELFAWQLEQRLYRMDQVPDALNRALLAMLGTRPRRTRCANTVLALRSDPSPIAAVTVGRRAEFTLAGAEPPMVYSTRTPLALLKIDSKANSRGLRLWVGSQERSADLDQARVFNLFPAVGGPSVVRIELTLTEAPAPAGGNAWFSLYLHLRTAASIAPQWSPDAAPGVPPPAPLAWLYRSNDGSLRPFGVDDGTGGLRRSGIVRLRIPADWKAEPAGLVYAIHLHTTRASFSSPPRLVSLVPNAVVARHARATRLHSVAQPLDKWLPLPGNVIRLNEWPRDEPDKDVPAVESACVLCMKERDAKNPDGRWHHWWPTASFHAWGPSHRVFIVDRERAQLRFGDGLNGRLPVLSAAGADHSNIRFRYVVGGGSAGAVGPSPGPDCDWEGPDGVRARNLTESLGSIEAETLEQARQRSAATLRISTRAVTRADFEDIALSTPGVAVKRAHAAIGRHPQHPCTSVPGAVTVYVVPDVPRAERGQTPMWRAREDLNSDLVEDAFVAAPIPDPGMLAAVHARLGRARLVTTELFVSAPHYRAVRLRAVLRGDVHDPSTLRQSIYDRLQRFLDPLVGGDDSSGWTFGEPVRASVMLREVQAAVGNEARVAQVSIGIDDDEPNESCRAVSIGEHELVWLKEVALQLDRNVVAAGGLR
jgi:predicted phage baseplate assembly protein